jgi:hypothetical protein
MNDLDTAIVFLRAMPPVPSPCKSDDSLFGNFYLLFGHAWRNKSEIIEAMMSLTLFSQWHKILYSGRYWLRHWAAVVGRSHDDAKKSWSRAKSILRKNPSVSQNIPELEELISIRLEAAQSASYEKVSRDRGAPIEERIHLLVSRT